MLALSQRGARHRNSVTARRSIGNRLADSRYEPPVCARPLPRSFFLSAVEGRDPDNGQNREQTANRVR